LEARSKQLKEQLEQANVKDEQQLRAENGLEIENIGACSEEDVKLAVKSVF
jgi:hypothetical protein